MKPFLFAFAGVVLMTAVVAPSCGETATRSANEPNWAKETGEDIIVTAQRRTEKAADVPIAMTVIDGRKLVDRGINSVTALAALIPGFSASDSGQNVPIFTIRGVGVNEASIAANPAVAIYVDEVPLPYAAMARGAALDLVRVEVLKGPQGTLYGANSTGGAINFVANAPTATNEGGIRASLGRFATAEVEGFVGGELAPDLDARIAIKTVQGSDWQRSVSRDDTLGERHKTDYRAAIAWSPGDRFALIVNASGWIDRSDTQAFQLGSLTLSQPANARFVPAGLLVLTSALRATGNRQADWNMGNDYARDDHLITTSAHAVWQLGDDVALTAISAYSRYASKAYQDRDATQFQNSANDFDGTIHSAYQELRLSGGTPNTLRWIVGANYRRDGIVDTFRNIFDQSTPAFVNGLRIPAANTDARTTVRASGIYGDAQLPLTPKLSLALGARYSRDDRDVAECSRIGATPQGGLSYDLIVAGIRSAVGLPPIPAIAVGGCSSLSASLAPELFQANLTEHNFSWRGVASYRPAAGTSLYVGASRGYKAGSFPTIAASRSAQFAPAKQESVLAFEAGIKSAIVPGLLRVDASAFHYNYDDKQVRGRIRDPLFGIIAALVNVPRSRILGVDFTAELTPLTGLSLTGSGTIIRTRVDRYVGFDLNAVLKDFSGQRLPFTPRMSLNGDIAYQRPLSATTSAFAGANIVYRSGSSAFFGDDPAVHLPAYATLDMRAGLTFGGGRRRVMLWGRNITGSHYWTNVARAIDTYARITEMPSTYGASFSLIL